MRTETTKNEESADQPFRKGFLPVWLHGCLWIMAMIGGWAAGLHLAWFLNELVGRPRDAFLPFVAVFFILGAVGTPALFLRLVPARCRNCGGRAWGSFRESLKFRCESCGDRRDTGITPASD